MLEDSKHDIGIVNGIVQDGVKDVTSMSEEEQLQYALALSRGESPSMPTPDANGNHKFTETTTQNGHDGWISAKDHDVWKNGIDAGGVNGIDEPDGNLEFGQPEQRLIIDSGDLSLAKLADYPQLGDVDQRLQSESSKTGELGVGETEMPLSASHQPGTNGVDQFGTNQVESRGTMNNGDVPLHEQSNGDSGFASPDVNGQIDDNGVVGNHGSNDSKLTADDSAIDIPPPNKYNGSKTDYSNVIDLCGDDASDAPQSAEGKDTAGSATGSEDTAGTGMSYAELKAKEEEEIRRATELSLQGEICYWFQRFTGAFC